MGMRIIQQVKFKAAEREDLMGQHQSELQKPGLIKHER